MTVEAVSQLVGRLAASTLALASLAAMLEEKAGDSRINSAMKPDIDRLLETLDVPEMLDGVEAPHLKPVIADIRSTLRLASRVALTPTSDPGWNVVDAQTLQTQGAVSARIPHNWKRDIVPRLEGLAARLESTNGAFLDVGVGVAALSISMAQLWPSLRVVGIDPWAPALEIARESVVKANLSKRIELREQGVQDLPDTDAFDLVWIPTQFIGGHLVRSALERIHRALRPGGWILAAAVRHDPDPFISASLRLRNTLRGGGSTAPAEIEALLKDLGYGQVQTLSGGVGTARGALVVASRT